MQKYYYDGISLSEYCKAHGIKVNSIIKGISRKKNNPKYKDLSEQEIVNTVMKKYGNSKKYMYGGMTLRQYCKKNNINDGTIYTRISQLKKEHPDLIDDDLVRLAMDDYVDNSTKYYYLGIPLSEFCRNNPNLSYNSIVDYIRNKKKENTTLSDEEIVKLYLSGEHNRYRYYYHGIPLKVYCEENDINYKNIINYIHKHRNDESYINLNDTELIEEIMNIYQPFVPKYLYKNMTLHRYCKENNLSYSGIVSYINSKQSKYKNLDIEKLIDEAVETINTYGIIYYYQGIPLKDYCTKNDLNVKSIRGSIWNKRKTSDTPLQEIVNECVELYKANNVKYFYKGESLIQFCSKTGISYNTIVDRYLKLNESVSIESIVDDYIANPINRKKYYFNNMTLSKFCDKNGYSYFSIYQRIKRLEKKEKYDTDMIRIKNSIDEYLKRLHIKNINDIFKSLKQMKIYNPDEIKKICCFLKINYDCVLELVERDFSYIQAINMIWYFNDSKDKQDNKIITDKKIDELLFLINEINKSADINIDQFRLYDLIGLYKSQLYDTRNEILNKQQRHIYKIAYNMCNIYGINSQSNIIDDFSSELKLIFLEVIENICLNTEGQIVKFINVTLKGNLRRYIESYKKNIPITSLDNYRFSDNKNNKMIDYIADPNNQFEELNNSTFSSTMMQVLSTLSPKDLSFVMLKYQGNYSYDDLANYFNLTIDEIEQKDIEILSLLKNNDSVKRMRKTKTDN